MCRWSCVPTGASIVLFWGRKASSSVCCPKRLPFPSAAAAPLLDFALNNDDRRRPVTILFNNRTASSAQVLLPLIISIFRLNVIMSLCHMSYVICQTSVICRIAFVLRHAKLKNHETTDTATPHLITANTRRAAMTTTTHYKLRAPHSIPCVCGLLCLLRIGSGSLLPASNRRLVHVDPKWVVV